MFINRQLYANESYLALAAAQGQNVSLQPIVNVGGYQVITSF